MGRRHALRERPTANSAGRYDLHHRQWGGIEVVHARDAKDLLAGLEREELRHGRRRRCPAQGNDARLAFQHAVQRIARRAHDTVENLGRGAVGARPRDDW